MKRAFCHVFMILITLQFLACDTMNMIQTTNQSKDINNYFRRFEARVGVHAMNASNEAAILSGSFFPTESAYSDAGVRRLMAKYHAVGDQLDYVEFTKFESTDQAVNVEAVFTGPDDQDVTLEFIFHTQSAAGVLKCSDPSLDIYLR